MSDSTLERSLKCRVPDFNGEESGSHRSEKLSDHILATSLIRADLAALRMGALAELRVARKEWRELRGWESYLRTSRDRTKEAVFEAKRQMKPELGEKIESAEWTIARCNEEMERLDKDATRCNQAFTIVSGG